LDLPEMMLMQLVETTQVQTSASINPCAQSLTSTNINLVFLGVSCDPTTFVKGMQAYVTQTTFAAGCKDVPCDSSDGFSEAVEAAKNADIVVLVAGLNLTEETEDHDRVSLNRIALLIFGIHLLTI
jgi:hypothetical protein